MRQLSDAVMIPRQLKKRAKASPGFEWLSTGQRLAGSEKSRAERKARFGGSDRSYGRLAMGVLLSLAAGAATFTGCSAEDEPPGAQCEVNPGTVFERRLAPVLFDDNPSSCNQCHLSGVDLGLFVRDTPCETLACLKELDLVNLKAPSESRVLTWISRADPDSSLITDAVIDTEYAAFLEWIEANAACPEACARATCGAEVVSGSCDLEPEPKGDALVPDDDGGCDDLSLERVFRKTVYATRGRCFPCHFEDNEFAPPSAPGWIAVDGNCDHASLTTLRRVVSLGYIDVEQPEQSKLLLKPLAIAEGGVLHGGHDKFEDRDDPGYQRLAYFAKRYAACALGATGSEGGAGGAMNSGGAGGATNSAGAGGVMNGSDTSAQP